MIFWEVVLFHKALSGYFFLPDLLLIYYGFIFMGILMSINIDNRNICDILTRRLFGINTFTPLILSLNLRILEFF